MTGVLIISCRCKGLGLNVEDSESHGLLRVFARD